MTRTPPILRTAAAVVQQARGTLLSDAAGLLVLGLLTVAILHLPA